MRCVLLGTGAAEGMPALFCECNVCEEARRRGGPDLRTRTGALIDGTVKIDLPPDTLAQAQRSPQTFRPGRVEHLLFTHSHDDHFAPRELQYLAPAFAPGREEQRPPLCVWGAPELLARLRGALAGCYQTPPLRLCPMEPFREECVGHLAVTPVPARHKPDELCFNFLLRSADGRTLLWGSDTGWWDPPTWRFLEGRRIDAVVLECGKGAVNGGYDGHLSADECVAVRERLVGAGGLPAGAPFLLTHISHTGMLLHAELSARVAPHGIRVAYDALELSV